MKRFILFFIILLMFTLLCADEFMQPLNNKIPIYTQPTAPQEYQGLRDRPAWSFITTPTGLISSYYDYMPGSYNSFPLRVQPDEQGLYVVFHGRETAASTRRVYFAYIDATGTVLNVATIGTEDIHQGYAGIGIDPVTADPMVSWHDTYTGGPIEWKCVFTYDLYHLGSPGLWKSPFTLIDETITTPFADDNFIWPYVWVGPSPEPDKRRVYVVARNKVSHQGSGNPSENELIGYADFNVSDLNAQSELDWTWQTIPELDGWNQGTPEEIRPNQAFTISDDGQVVFIGYSSTGGSSAIGDQLYVFYNDNYGEGGFEHIAVTAEWDIENPLNQDGTPRFPDENGQPHDLYMEPYLCNHANGIFTHDNTKIQWLGNMNMMIRPDQWYPDLLLMYLKLYTYDIATQEFTFQDFVDLPGVNPTDNTPVLPWDIDEDGVVDNFDPDGYVEWVPGHPIYFDVSDMMFHENTNKLTKNDDKNWLAAVWMDGVKNRYAVLGYGYPGWETYAELKIALSADNGENWSEPITMNAKADDDNYVLEFDGMKPCYFYPSDKIIDLGDDHGKLDIFFYNDNSFGSYSSPGGHGSNDGGTITYMSLDLDFSELPSHAQPNIVTLVPVRLHQNYPNPFNPETTIAYSLQEPANVTLEIFNMKGQKVRTLINAYQQAGNHNIVWNAKDSNNHEVSSGVYFYKLVSESNFGDYTSSKKMLFLK